MSNSWCVVLLAMLASLAPGQNPPVPSAPGQNPPGKAPIGLACSWISRDDPKLQPVAQVCEQAHSMRQALPNFICNQQTRRSRPVPVMNIGRPSFREGVDVITAQVTYENGEEHFAARPPQAVGTDSPPTA